MKIFILQHIDAIITTALALCLLIYAWKHRKRLQSSPRKIDRALPALAIVLLLIGLLRLAFDSQPAYVWQRVYSDDQRASAEFPRPTDTEIDTTSAKGISIRRIQCDVPYKSINLRLSHNDIPPEGLGPTVEQRIEAVLSNFKQQGLTVVSCIPEKNADAPCYRIVVEKDGGKIQISWRIAITPKALYGAMATSTGGYHDDPVIARFLDSFKIQ